jgi:hypothetical protein
MSKEINKETTAEDIIKLFFIMFFAIVMMPIFLKGCFNGGNNGPNPAGIISKGIERDK